MVRASEVYLFNSYELPRRAGRDEGISLDITIPERIGIDVIAVPAGAEIHLEMRLESVTEGVLVSAELSAVADGECMRCLDRSNCRLIAEFKNSIDMHPKSHILRPNASVRAKWLMTLMTTTI